MNIRREGVPMNIRKWVTSSASLSCTPVVILLTLMASPIPLSGADDKDVGGHVGFGFPLVTKDGANVSSLADNFQMGLPIAITVNGRESPATRCFEV